MKDNNKVIDISEITALIDERKAELCELLSSLIKINSENFRSYGNEKEIAEYIGKLCVELGLETDIFSPMDLENFENHPDYMPGRTLEEKRNVAAKWRGKEDRNALMLMAHHDTVEVGDVANWHDDPWSGAIKDGRVYGRGACDDKYAIAAALFIIKLLKEKGFEPKANIVFAAYCDEEHGGSHGALAAVLRDPCDRVVSMDCADNIIWNCASGGGEYRYLFSTRKTVDSARLAAKALPIVLEEIDKFGERRYAELSANRFYCDTNIPGTSLRYMDVRAGNNCLDLGKGAVRFTYYTDKSREEIRAELDEVDAIIKKRLDELDIDGLGFVPHTRFFHYVQIDPDDPAILDMVEAGREASGSEIEVTGSCLSDLSVIAKYGKGSAFAYGAGRDFSADGGAHQPNEFIEIDSLVRFTKNIAAYVLKVVG